MPCSIKDHFDNFKENILTQNAKAENPNAEEMRSDPVYVDILKDYGKELERLAQKLFKEEYLSNGLKETVGLKLETNQQASSARRYPGNNAIWYRVPWEDKTQYNSASGWSGY